MKPRGLNLVGYYVMPAGSYRILEGMEYLHLQDESVQDVLSFDHWTIYQSIQRNIPEDLNVQQYPCQYLKADVQQHLCEHLKSGCSATPL